MKYLNFKMVCLFCILLILSVPNSGLPQNSKPVENILSLKISFGDSKELPDGYLLVRPQGLVVLKNGNIVVTDDFKLKMFNIDGKPEKIIGKSGQGPGEFQTIGSLFISPVGKISIYASYTYFDIYSEDLEFIERVSIAYNPNYQFIKDRFNLSKSFRIHTLIPINQKDKLLVIEGRDIDKFGYKIIAYQCGDVIKIVDDYKFIAEYTTKKGSFALSARGDSYLKLLPNECILFTHSLTEIEKKDNRYYFNLYISHYDGSVRKIISHSFKPVKLDDYLMPNDESKKILKSYPYYPAIQDLKVDSNYIFVFTYEKNEKEEILTHIFNAEKAEYIRSAFFPFIPSKIKNKIAYRLKVPDFRVYYETFRKSMSKEYIEKNSFYPVIEIYEINPIIFEKSKWPMTNVQWQMRKEN